MLRVDNDTPGVYYEDLQGAPDVKVGDLVSVAMYESPRGLMVASPEWLIGNKNPTQPELHNSKSRTRAVSALVVGSRSAWPKEGRPMLEVVIGPDRTEVPIACVVEVLNRG